jgi:hypothetical protein
VRKRACVSSVACVNAGGVTVTQQPAITKAKSQVREEIQKTRGRTAAGTTMQSEKTEQESRLSRKQSLPPRQKLSMERMQPSPMAPPPSEQRLHPGQPLPLPAQLPAADE